MSTEPCHSDDGNPLLEVRDLKMHFPVKTGLLPGNRQVNRAVDGVSLSIMPGQTLGLVGESGCGKSTLGRTIARLYQPSAGSIRFRGENITTLSQRQLRPLRPDLQMIFQDPMESLNSRQTVADILEEPLIIHRQGDSMARQQRVCQLLDLVGLPAASGSRYPFEFSGGQRQRISIARAIALNPKLIICDEPVSALDVSIQSQILNLLVDLQGELKLSYLFIAHDLAVVKHIADTIAVMYLGKIVERGIGSDIYQRPRHPYTQSLMAAIPIADPHRRVDRVLLSGDVPSPIAPPSGCSFHPRCPQSTAHCSVQTPSTQVLGRDHSAACLNL